LIPAGTRFEFNKSLTIPPDQPPPPPPPSEEELEFDRELDYLAESDLAVGGKGDLDSDE
jgi:hypothetical protein